MNAYPSAEKHSGFSHDGQLPKIFYPSAQDYIYPMDAALEDPQGANSYLPIEVDTEFYHAPLDFTTNNWELSPTITVQCKSIALEPGVIFSHPNIRPVGRHREFETEFIVIDYLRFLGHTAHLERVDWIRTDLPVLQIDLYAFFAVAELLRIVEGGCRDDVIVQCLDSRLENHGITQGRRLRSFTRIRGKHMPWIALPWVITLNGRQYQVRLAWYDTSAVHGTTGYAGFCNNTGVEIPYKDVFSSEAKGRMNQQYFFRHTDFENYALGDLYNHKALSLNVELTRAIYDAVELSAFFRIPRLTIGAFVRDLMESVVGRMCYKVHPGVEVRELVNAYCKYSSASELKKCGNTTAVYNAKVDGGRCRNNRPTDTKVRGVIADLDISGCYGEGLRVQLYPLGVPVIFSYPLNTASNDYMTLGDFLKRYGKELVPGLYQLRVSLPEGYSLKYAQDFIMSWFPPRDISKLPTDTELEESEEWWTEDNVGLTKVFTHQIHLGLVNHDTVQWIQNIASVRQRKELLDNLRVVTAMYYPASDRVSSVEKLREAHDNHVGKNTCTVKKIRGKTTKIQVEQQCHAWYAETLGDAIVTKLLQERKKHRKKTPLNELYKLCVNTIAGDMISAYFTVGNTVVGNNITARARATAWYMEKGLHGYPTITDGCPFDLNRVLYPGKVRVNGESVVGIYRKGTRDTNLEFRPLGGLASINIQGYSDGLAGLNLSHQCESLANPCSTAYGDCPQVTDTCITVLDPEASLQWINKTAMEHLQRLFPNVDVLHEISTDVFNNARVGRFEFEAKGIYDTACFHGSANYCFQRFGEVQRVAMRSYSRRPVEIIDNTCRQVLSEGVDPALEFLSALMQNPEKVRRQQVFLKSSILKLGDYSRNYAHKFKQSKVFPGMTVKQASLLREFSLAQFTYQDIDQYRAWEHENERLRRNYGQSYEMYFLNLDGTLNYQQMIETIDQLVWEGKKGYWDGKDKRSSNGYRSQVKHPSLDTLEYTRKSLAQYYGFIPASDQSSSETDITSDEQLFALDNDQS